MGHLEFGKLAKIRGIVFFRLSPHEMNPLHGMVSHGVPNMIRRIRESIFKVVPRKFYIIIDINKLINIYLNLNETFSAFIATYMLIQWADNENERLSRKNPKDFENDK